jgi:hypothetical protein
MGEVILATELLELGEAVVEELKRHLGGLLALKEMLVELLATDQTDGAGLVGTDGDRSGIAVETVGIVAHKVARSDGLDRALVTLVVTDKVMETAALNVTKAAGGGSFGLKDVAMREVHSPTMVQTVVAQIGQGVRIMCFLFHTLMILQFFAYKITKKSVKNNSAKPENRSPRVQL